MPDPHSNGHGPQQPPPGPPAPSVTRGDLPFDPGNDMLSVVPCKLTASVQDTPVGQRMGTTIRTVDTTLTLFLARDEVDNWINVLTQVRAQMTGLILPGG